MGQQVSPTPLPPVITWPPSHNLIAPFINLITKDRHRQQHGHHAGHYQGQHGWSSYAAARSGRSAPNHHPAQNLKKVAPKPKKESLIEASKLAKDANYKYSLSGGCRTIRSGIPLPYPRSSDWGGCYYVEYTRYDWVEYAMESAVESALQALLYSCVRL